MSFRSGSNTDFTFNNLKVNSTLTLANNLDIANLEVQGDTKLNTLEVEGDTTLNNLEVEGDNTLNNLKVEGDTGLTDLQGTNKATVNALDCNDIVNLNNQTNVVGNVVANNEIITPEELGYVSGATDNIQRQLDTKVNVNNPTGVAVMPTTKLNGYTYIGNDGTALPTFNPSNYFGVIGANITQGHGEMDFVNTGYDETNGTLSAFDWYEMTSSTTKELLMRLYHGLWFVKCGWRNNHLDKNSIRSIKFSQCECHRKSKCNGTNNECYTK